MNELEQLRQQVEEFKQWKAQKEREQITFPLDIGSKRVISKDVMLITGNAIAYADLPVFETAIEIEVNGMRIWVIAQPI